MLLLLAYLFVYSYVALPRPAFGNDNTYSFFNRYYLLLFGLLAYRDCGKADVSIHLFQDPVGFKPVLFRLSLHQQLYATKEILKATQRPSKIMNKVGFQNSTYYQEMFEFSGTQSHPPHNHTLQKLDLVYLFPQLIGYDDVMKQQLHGTSAY